MVKRYRNREGAAEAKILELLLAKGKAYGSLISRRAEIPIGSIPNTLGSLVRNGLVERDAEKNWYLTEKGVGMAMLNREYAARRAELERRWERPKEALACLYGSPSRRDGGLSGAGSSEAPAGTMEEAMTAWSGSNISKHPKQNIA